MTIRDLQRERQQERLASLGGCEHRTVAPDGRIVCRKIARGETQVSPALCRACPVHTVDCTHLRFSLRHSSPSPLVVRFNGRTEVWNDAPPALQFEQAACAEQVVPIHSTAACAACRLRQPLALPADWRSGAGQPADRRPAAAQPAEPARPGNVVPFPERDRESLAATG